MGWEKLDVILVTGDAYIDSPFIGAALIGKALAAKGYRVGIISQPNLDSPHDISRLGEPALFWGVSGGSLDSMVANYTASNKRRKSDDLTPGGLNTRRPDRAVIAYSNAIRRFFKNTAPIVLGGIEASLRRVAHYDYWSDKVRRPILFDAKADYLLYGMAEQSVLELAAALSCDADPTKIRGLCYIARQERLEELRGGGEEYVELPSFEDSSHPAAKYIFEKMFIDFYSNCDPKSAAGLLQKTGDRWLVHNPPAHLPTPQQLDSLHEPPPAFAFERLPHPAHEKEGKIRAQETISSSILTHRGCYGECNYCAIGVHQGRSVVSRTPDSIVREAKSIAAMPNFKGSLLDVGGPTANMYGYECPKKLKSGVCHEKRCLFPKTCPTMPVDHSPLIKLLNRLKALAGVKNVFVASGIRHDLVLADASHGEAYLGEVARHHTSGQLKVAPEHLDDEVLRLMGKPPNDTLDHFRDLFGRFSKGAGKQQFLTYYFIAAHPGCGVGEMRALKGEALRRLAIRPEQAQIFTPTPSTFSTLMYYTGRDPFSGRKIFVEKSQPARVRQKEILVGSNSKVGRKGKSKS